MLPAGWGLRKQTSLQPGSWLRGQAAGRLGLGVRTCWPLHEYICTVVRIASFSSLVAPMPLVACHLPLATGVESVIHRTLQLDLPVVVFGVDEGEAVSDGVEAGSLRTVVAVSRDVGAVNDLGETLERLILEAVLDNDRFKAATAIDVPELNVRYVVGDRIFALRRRHHFLGGNVEECGLAVDEPLDEPRARHPIYVGVLPSHPFHGVPPC